MFFLQKEEKLFLMGTQKLLKIFLSSLFIKTGIISKLYFVESCAGNVVVNAGLPKKFNSFTNILQIRR